MSEYVLSEKVVSLLAYRFAKDIARELYKTSNPEHSIFLEKKRASLELFHRMSGHIIFSNNFTDLEKFEMLKEAYTESMR